MKRIAAMSDDDRMRPGRQEEIEEVVFQAAHFRNSIS
jgi:hypothetical protein